MTTDALLDVDKTLEAFGGDDTLFRRVAQTFARTAPELLKAVSAAFTGGDVKRVYTEAHSLKGAVGVFEAPQVFNRVAELAQHAKNNDLAAARDAFAAAQPLVERLLGELAPIASAAGTAAGPNGR